MLDPDEVDSPGVPKGFPVRGVGIIESGGLGPVHGLIWILAGSYGEESPKTLRKQNAENVLFVRSMVQSIEETHSPTTTIYDPSWGATMIGS